MAVFTKWRCNFFAKKLFPFPDTKTGEGHFPSFPFLFHPQWRNLPFSFPAPNLSAAVLAYFCNMLYLTAIAKVRATSWEEPNCQDHTHKELPTCSLLQNSSWDGLFIPLKFGSASYLWLELLHHLPGDYKTELLSSPPQNFWISSSIIIPTVMYQWGKTSFICRHSC